MTITKEEKKKKTTKKLSPFFHFMKFLVMWFEMLVFDVILEFVNFHFDSGSQRETSKVVSFSIKCLFPRVVHCGRRHFVEACYTY